MDAFGRTMSKICDDCGTVEGSFHEAFCTRERCPFCGDQLISCGCISHVLELDPEEQKAFNEYEDDSTAPLAGVVRRWGKALNRKGRIPFWRGRTHRLDGCFGALATAAI